MAGCAQQNFPSSIEYTAIVWGSKMGNDGPTLSLKPSFWCDGCDFLYVVVTCKPKIFLLNQEVSCISQTLNHLNEDIADKTETKL